MTIVQSLLYAFCLYGAFMAGIVFLRTRAATQPGTRTLPWLTLLVTSAVALPTTLQFFSPSLLTALERDAARVAAGEVWRLLTSLLVQDGGVSGSVFNLVSLLLIGSVAEQLWRRWQWLLLFLLGGVLSELVGLVWDPIGAGNSVANFSLAAGVAVWCLMRDSSRPVQLAAVLTLGTGVVLFGLRDIHGAAVLWGTGIALGSLWLERSKVVKV